jgi:hypothetical protein
VHLLMVPRATGWARVPLRGRAVVVIAVRAFTSRSPAPAARHGSSRPLHPSPPPHPQAACKRFEQHCFERARPLPKGRDDFALSYETNIPRQAGLSGSSAIACATLNCLFAHYGVSWEVRRGGGGVGVKGGCGG